MEKRSILKGASVLLIAAVMILSTFAVTANTNEQKVQDTAEALNLGDVTRNNPKLSSSTNMANMMGKGQTCYAFEIYLYDMSITFETDNPGTLTTIGAMTSTEFMAGGCWADGTWFGCEYSEPLNSNIWTIDETTGAMTLIGASGAGLNGMAYDDTTDTLFGCSGTHLYTIDKTTGAGTLVGAMGNAGGLMIGMACDNDGNLYGEDIGDDSLYSIDSTTGSATLIGSFGGIDLNYAQDMAYDKNNDILYLSALTIHAGNQGSLYSVDVTTGAATLIGMLDTQLVEVGCFAIPYEGEEPPVVPDLDCDGSLSWTGVTPEETVTGTFTVENIGDPLSLLDWEIESYPDWGTFTFDPDGGLDLTPEAGAVTVTVEVVAPEDPETNFTGEIVLVNSEDPDDICIIDVALATPVSQQSLIFQFFEMLAQRFPILGMILAALF